MKKRWYIPVLALVLGLAAIRAVVNAPRKPPQRSTTQHGRNLGPLAPRNVTEISEFGSLPMSFEANHGQAANEIKFLARGKGYTLFLTPDAFLVSVRKSAMREEPQNASPGTTTPVGNGNLFLNRIKPNIVSKSPEESAVLRVNLIGADPHSHATGVEKRPGTTNYFIGNDPRKWTTNIPSYVRARFEQVYRGVDMVYYSNQGQLEYDFVVAPGADPSVIRLGVEGKDDMAVNSKGDLILHARNREVLLRKPVAYQEMDGLRRSVGIRYILESKYRLGFEVSAFDAARPLIIDPVLSFSSYLGGTEDDSAKGIAVDAAGDLYITGPTQSLDFPVTAGAFQQSCAINVACGNAFITKVNPATGTILYSTYLGGHGANQGNAIAVDSLGNAYITGETYALDFPVTPGAFQQNRPGSSEAFVTKLNADGSALLYSTYLGGLFQNRGLGIAADLSGNAYVTGVVAVVPGLATQPNFPVTPGAAQVAFNGGLPCPLTGSCGDGFVTKMNPSGSALVYSTYLGGSDVDDALAIALDSSGSAYITGDTFSSDFPTSSQAFQKSCTLRPPPRFPGCSGDAFITKMSADGSAFLYSTYLGGDDQDYSTGISVDAGGNAYVAGYTSSATFPVTAGALLTVYPGSQQTAFVTKMNPTGSAPVYSTYLGGTTSAGGEQGHAIATDQAGHAYITGIGTTFDFPEVNPIQSSKSGAVNVFVSELSSVGDALVFSTHLGGHIGLGPQDSGQAIAVDNLGNIYIAGITGKVDFPTVNAFQPECAGGCMNDFGNSTSDAFVAMISPANSPMASVSPTVLQFPSTIVGSTSQPQPVVLLDVGSAPLAVSGVATTGDFAESNSCGTAVNGGGNCTLSVTFTPTASGTRTGTLTITDSAPNSPQVIPLSGSSPSPPDFTLAATAFSPATVSAGGSATSTISVNPLNGFSGAVTFSCTVSPVVKPASTCAFNPGTINASGTAVITVNTTAPHVVSAPNSGRHRNLLYALFLPVGGLTFLGVSFATRRTNMLGRILGCLLFSSLLLLGACGGGTTSMTTPPPPSGGTPSGSYTVTVIATSGSLSHTMSATLRVQ